MKCMDIFLFLQYWVKRLYKQEVPGCSLKSIFLRKGKQGLNKVKDEYPQLPFLKLSHTSPGRDKIVLRVGFVVLVKDNLFHSLGIILGTETHFSSKL